MADQLREGAVPCLANVVSPGRSIDGRLVDVPEERRESRRLVSQALWRRHHASVCSRQLHNTVPARDVGGVEIVHQVRKLDWGDIP